MSDIEETQRLREKYDREYKHSTELGNTIDRLAYELAVANRRIEELEGMLNTPVQCPQCNLHLGSYGVAIAESYIITRDQIRAAWKRMTRLIDSANTAEYFMGRGMMCALKQDLGIKEVEDE